MSDDRGTTDGPQLDGLVDRARHELRDWTDTTDRDPGVALLELFALVGDLLSSHSERLAAEAHLASERRRRPVGQRNEIEIEIDGRPWLQVSDLAGSAAQDHHYVVSRRDDGASVIEFGDGVHGQRPPTGSSRGVSYRSGAGAWSVLLDQGSIVVDTDESPARTRGTGGLHRATVLDNADPRGQRRLLVLVPDVSGQAPVWAAACRPVAGAEDVPAIGEGVWVALESGDPSRPVWLGRVSEPGRG